MNFICWHYVASGGNIEFCPYYSPNKETEIEVDEDKEKETEEEVRIVVDNVNNLNETATHTTSKLKESSICQEHSPEQRFLRHSLKKFNRSTSSLCQAYHISRPVTEIPILLRVFEVDDFFPIARYVRTYSPFHFPFFLHSFVFL